MSAGNVAAGELKEKLAAQGAGNIDLKTAEEYIKLVNDYDLNDKRSSVLKAIGLYYKSNGNLGAARNVVRVERAERAAAAKKKKEDETKNSTSTDEKMDIDNEKKDEEKPKKKSKTYKEIMKSITMDKKNSEERREAHKKHLKKNLGGGSFDKIDKI